MWKSSIFNIVRVLNYGNLVYAQNTDQDHKVCTVHGCKKQIHALHKKVWIAVSVCIIILNNYLRTKAIYQKFPSIVKSFSF